METAKLLLGQGRELNSFVSQLLDDIANLKAMLHAISIGASTPIGGAVKRLCGSLHSASYIEDVESALPPHCILLI